MRRRMLNQMQTEQDEHSRSEAVKARLVPSLRLMEAMAKEAKARTAQGGVILPLGPMGENFLREYQNDSVAPQGTMPSSPPVTVPPAPGAPKRKAGWPKGKKRGPRK